MIRLAVPSIGDAECAAVERVLRSGNLVHGEECELFEQELALYLGCKDVVVVSSGTAALHLSLLALDIGPGDAVLVPDFTFPATINVIELVGARPILVDVDLFTYNITPGNIRRTIYNWQGPEKIKAIMPVHEFGCPADMTAIMQIAKEHQLLVVEDAACGFGTIHNGQKVGTFGLTGCFSFHPRKAITTGEGGAIATNNLKVAEKLRLLRAHGMAKSSFGTMDFLEAGYNYRLTNFQAALGRCQLRCFDQWLQVRKKIQDFYRENLLALTVQLPEISSGHSWQTFMVVLPEFVDRKDISEQLKTAGIENNLGAYALHELAYYKQQYPQMCSEMQKNQSEVLFQRGLAIPCHQNMSIDDANEVVVALRKAIGG